MPLVNTFKRRPYIHLVVVIRLAADGNAALCVVSVLLAPHTWRQFTRHHQLEQAIAVHVTLTVKVIQVESTVPGAVATVIANAFGQRVIHAISLHEKFRTPRVEAVLRLGQRGNVGAVRPPEVPGIVGVLILHTTGVVSFQQSA